MVTGHAANQLRIVRALWRGLQPLGRTTPFRMRAALADRRFGARDRRLYRELLLTAVRHARVLVSLEGDEIAWARVIATGCADAPETKGFRAAFADPARLLHFSPLELVPPWFAEHADTGRSPADDAAALLTRAPVWVRFQTDDPEPALVEWAAQGWTAVRHPILADAWKLPPETDVSGCKAYQEGHYEIQDVGSQRLLADLDLPARGPGLCWLDACAGAGGKTLQLARLLGPSAHIEASDVRRFPLDELARRARRANLAKRIRLLLPGDSPGRDYDGVLVDAPCSGGGTWRRAPHLMACTTPTDLRASAQRQIAILEEAARRVRPGGWLIYATCSIFRDENREVAEDFLNKRPDFSLMMPFTTYAPGVEDNDGFFRAVFRRNSLARGAA